MAIKHDVNVSVSPVSKIHQGPTHCRSFEVLIIKNKSVDRDEGDS